MIVVDTTTCIATFRQHWRKSIFRSSLRDHSELATWPNMSAWSPYRASFCLIAKEKIDWASPKEGPTCLGSFGEKYLQLLHGLFGSNVPELPNDRCHFRFLHGWCWPMTCRFLSPDAADIDVGEPRGTPDHQSVARVRPGTCWLRKNLW